MDFKCIKEHIILCIFTIITNWFYARVSISALYNYFFTFTNVVKMTLQYSKLQILHIKLVLERNNFPAQLKAYKLKLHRVLVYLNIHDWCTSFYENQ
jgi:hypothetical protein